VASALVPELVNAAVLSTVAAQTVALQPGSGPEDAAAARAAATATADLVTIASRAFVSGAAVGASKGSSISALMDWMWILPLNPYETQCMR